MDTSGRKKKRKRWLFEKILFLLIVVSIIAWQAYTRPVYFFLQTVAVAGNQKIATEEIYHMAGFIEGYGPLWIWDAKDFLQTLRGDLRVAEVRTEYDWPSTLTIFIKERRSVAHMASRYGFLSLDSSGTVLAVSHSLKKMEAPMITGFKAGRVFPGQRIEDAGVYVALDYLTALDGETRDRLSEVNIGAANGAIVVTMDNIKIQLGPLERVRNKARLTQVILQEIGAKGMAVDSIDLVHETPVLRFRRP